MSYQILENTAELPKGSGFVKRKYPFDELKVGASFIVPASENPKLNSLQSACHHWKKKLDRDFSCVKLPDGSIQVRRNADDHKIAAEVIAPYQAPVDIAEQFKATVTDDAKLNMIRSKALFMTGPDGQAPGAWRTEDYPHLEAQELALMGGAVMNGGNAG